MTQPRVVQLREGFSLVEVVMAIVLLAIILVSLAGLTFQTAQRAVVLADESARHGVLLQEVNRLSAMPYSSLPVQNDTCGTLSVGNHDFQRCVRITQETTRSVQVRVVVRSLRHSAVPDTVIFTRAMMPAVSPFN